MQIIILIKSKDILAMENTKFCYLFFLCMNHFEEFSINKQRFDSQNTKIGDKVVRNSKQMLSERRPVWKNKECEKPADRIALD